jgi:O-antigen/teichoic acid export membrane protein
MIRHLNGFIRRTFFEGAPRSIQAKQNIVGLFFLRGVSTAINFVLVPLTLGYLSSNGFGIWLTLNSILAWVIWLDVGLGNGLRNRFAVALAHNDKELARSLVSTTYLFVGLISLSLIVLFLCAQPLLSWSGILMVPPEMNQELTLLATVVFIFFCIRLVVGLIGTILAADQQPALSSLFEVLVSALSLVAIIVLTKIRPGSLFWLGTCMSAAMVIVPIIGNIWLFRGRYREFTPSLRYVRVIHAKGLMHIGLQFFLLQLAGLVLFAGSNLIIKRLLGADEVTQFNIAFKYFGVPAGIFTMLLTPFWSAYTDAYARGDISWIRMTFRKLVRAMVLLSIAVVIMVAAADRVYELWIGHSVHVPFSLSVVMGLYVLIVAWSSIFSYFVNGTGKIRLQLLVAIPTSVAMVPLAVYLAGSVGLGTTGVVLAICIVLLPGTVLWPVQTRKLLNKRATGVWSQ